MSDFKKENDALDELLSSMPKFTDHRSKEDVYNRVKEEMEDSSKPHKRKTIGSTSTKWMPITASIASVLLLTFLVTSFLNDKETSMSKFEMSDQLENKEAAPQATRSMENQDSNKAAVTTEEASESPAIATFSMPTIELAPVEQTNAVYANQLNGGTVFHFSFIENALSVPVTIVIPKEQMELDFPNTTPNSLELYERYASMIDEEALGFDAYHPYKGYFVAEGKMLKQHLPVDHGYDYAPGVSAPYWSSLNEIFTDFDELMRVNEDGTAIYWAETGILNEPSPLNGAQAHQSYFKYISLNKETYLSSNFGKRFDTLSEAFSNMKTPENDIYFSVIPNEVTYSYKDDKGIAVISFDKPLDLATMDSNDVDLMIEAFALTAASFGSEVKLENIVQTEWNEFDLTKELPVPSGPNGFILNMK
ncbi:hypothetical protein [Psychrobacillus sp.]|uniref:hypothetical protein n=1 Tax=Psychrobacillus sp. TaxID=1871623 RepID=UPI0028BE12B1|nr:hypothetical protein [Psychrobacillus sp.]